MAAVHVGVPKDMEHLIPRFLDALEVGRVHHKNQSIGVDEIVTPEWPQLGLAPDVPGWNRGGTEENIRAKK